MIPFSARMVAEHLRYDGSGAACCRENEEVSGRAWMNEGVQQLVFFRARDSVCKLSEFVKNPDHARHCAYSNYEKWFVTLNRLGLPISN